MVLVALLAFGFGLLAHIRRVIQEEPDFYPQILYLQGMLASILLWFGLAVWSAIDFVQRDKVYARNLHRDRADPIDFDAIDS
jgi:hypothetical protein